MILELSKFELLAPQKSLTTILWGFSVFRSVIARALPEAISVEIATGATAVGPRDDE